MATAIISDNSGAQLAYWIGDKIYGETTPKEVNPQYVNLNNRANEELLKLSEEAVVLTGNTIDPISSSSTPAVVIPTHPADIRIPHIANR